MPKTAIRPSSAVEPVTSAKTTVTTLADLSRPLLGLRQWRRAAVAEPGPVGVLLSARGTSLHRASESAATT